jgi:threonine synthase
MSIWRHAQFIAPVPPASRLTLGEGDTPLIRSRSIGPAAGLPNLFFKLESCNPTGSYKDRFAAAALSDMLAGGKKRCVATSSGNTGAALAAYCAAASIPCSIAIVEAAPAAKLSQMLAYGARLFRVRGFGPDPAITQQTFSILQQFGQAPDAALQISAFRYSPAGMSGVQTLSHELAEQMAQFGGSVDHVFTPSGGGGLTLAVARGFAQLHGKSPAIHCVQPAGNDTIATPLSTGANRARAVTCTSKISGLQVSSVIDGDEVVTACRATGGTGHVIRDEQAWEAQKMLARQEGVFSEPAGAVALAGALQAVQNGLIDKNAVIVCLVTGSGFKDTASVDAMVQGQSIPLIEADALARSL